MVILPASSPFLFLDVLIILLLLSVDCVHCLLKLWLVTLVHVFIISHLDYITAFYLPAHDNFHLPIHYSHCSQSTFPKPWLSHVPQLLKILMTQRVLRKKSKLLNMTYKVNRLATPPNPQSSVLFYYLLSHSLRSSLTKTCLIGTGFCKFSPPFFT